MTKDFIRRDSNSVKWDLAGADVLPMWVADMDFPVSEVIISALEERLRHPFMGYSFLPESYYQAFIDWAQMYQGWKIERDWLIYSPSVMASLRLAVDEYSVPGEGIIIPSPVYYPFFSAARDKGRSIVESPLAFDEANRRYVFDFENLEDLAAKKENSVLLLCNPHNPLGRVWERDELATLVDICRRNEVFVISDEIHADIIHAPHRFSPMAPLLVEKDYSGGGLAIQAPSKTFNIPGLLSSQIIAPGAAVRATMEKGVSASGLELPNVLATTASEAAYRSGRPWLEDIGRKLASNIARIEEFLDDSPLAESRRTVPQGTYLYWLDLRGIEAGRGMNSREAFKSLKHRAGLWLSPGYMFSESAAGFYRLNFACPEDILSEGLKRLDSWMREA